MAVNSSSSSPLPSSIIIGFLILVSISFSPIAMGGKLTPTTFPSWVLEIIAVAVSRGSSLLSTAINAIQFVTDVCNDASSSDNLVDSVLKEITAEIIKSGSFARDARQAVCDQLRERIPKNGAGGTGYYPGGGAGGTGYYPGGGNIFNNSAAALQGFPSHQLIHMQLAIGLLVTLAAYYL